jgi:hypothetical protein
MKKHLTLCCTLIFFLLVNTQYLWGDFDGIDGFITFLFLVTFWFALIILFVFQILFLIKEKFSNKKRIFTSLFLLSVLIIAYLFPFGIIDFYIKQKENRESLIIAKSEHTITTITLKLLKNNTFIDREVKTQRGKYEIKGDTIFFQAKNYDYEYGIIEHKPHLKDERIRKDICVIKVYDYNDKNIDMFIIKENKFNQCSLCSKN